MNRRVTRIAVVGFGYWGSKHVRVLSSIPDVAVTVVDGDEGRLTEAEARYPAVRTARRLQDILDEVDGVAVATPPTTHFAVAQEALAAGRHVMVEKPLATTVPDAEALVATAGEHGSTLMADHTFEYNAAVRKLREIIRSGSLGRVLYIDAARLNLGLYRSDVNVVWDLAPHDISIATYLLDDFPTACSVWARRNIGRRHADVAYLRMEFPTAHAFVHLSWLNPNKVRRTTVVGEQKMAVYDDLSDTERIRIYDIGVDPAVAEGADATGEMPVSYRTGDIISPYVPFREPLLVQDEHFVECVRTGAKPDTPGERGLDVVRVLAATDEALASGRLAAIGGIAAATAGTAPVLVPDRRAAAS